MLVKAYGCEPETAAGEMLLCIKEYETYIGRREEKKSGIVLYQIRQSFTPVFATDLCLRVNGADAFILHFLYNCQKPKTQDIIFAYPMI